MQNDLFQSLLATRKDSNLSRLIIRALVLVWSLMGPPGLAAPCGSTDAWSLVVDEGVNTIFTDTVAAMAGSQCGLVVAPNNDQLKRYIQDESPAAVGPNGADSYRLSFYFDPNSIPLPTGANVKIAVFHTLSPGAPFVNVALLKVRKDPSGYILKAWARSGNTASDKSIIELPLIDGPNVIETQLTIGSGDGIFRVWVNNNNEGTPNHEDLTLNNAAYQGIDRIRLGIISSTQPITGQMYFDEVVSRTVRFIGSQR